MTSRRLSLELPTAADTVALGARLAAACRVGDVLALNGPLGAGKTTLVHGLAAALGVVGPVPSPTFVIVREHLGRLPLYHIDAYRLSDADEASACGIDELLPSDGVSVVEWAERIAELLPPETLTVTLQIVGTGRRATVDGPSLERFEREVRGDG